MKPKDRRLVTVVVEGERRVAIELARYTTPDPNDAELVQLYTLVVSPVKGDGSSAPYLVHESQIFPYGLEEKIGVNRHSCLEWANRRILELETAIEDHRLQKYGETEVRSGYTLDLQLYATLGGRP